MQPFAKKGRPTTSCSECARRKQKVLVPPAVLFRCDLTQPMVSVTGNNHVTTVLLETLRTGVLTVDTHRRYTQMLYFDNMSSLSSSQHDSPSVLDERGPGMRLSPVNDLTESVQHSHQLGYSSVAGSNSFVELGRVVYTLAYK